jgi:hypothetical protein
MKQTLIFILLISFKVSYSQSFYFDGLFDYSEINKTIDSLKKKNVKEILIVKTELLKLCNYNDDSVVTLTIWPDANGLFNFRIIGANVIYKQFKCKLQDNVFRYAHRFDTFVSKDEAILKYVPPLTNNNAVFYISSTKSGYFEREDRDHTNPTTYVVSNLTKERYRKEWFTLILSNLNKLNYNLIKEKEYNRFEESEK